MPRRPGERLSSGRRRARPGDRGRCPECARLDRARSVAADTFLDDPQPYRVYLAWFGPGMTKVGITAEARGEARLLEQGAVTFSWLGRGPLMAARRTEEVLRQALGVPDRVAYERKRAARHALPSAPARAGEVEALYRRAREVGGWTETLEPLAFAPRDHVGAFGLDGLPPLAGTVSELVDGVSSADGCSPPPVPTCTSSTPPDGASPSTPG